MEVQYDPWLGMWTVNFTDEDMKDAISSDGMRTVDGVVMALAVARHSHGNVRIMKDDRSDVVEPFWMEADEDCDPHLAI